MSVSSAWSRFALNSVAQTMENMEPFPYSDINLL